jgi:hypothetical protein
MGLRGKHTKIEFDSSAPALTDITTHVMESNGIPLSYDEIEDSAYSQDHSTMKGQGDSSPTLKIKFNDTTHALFTHATTGALFSDTARTLTISYGENAAPAAGDLTVTGEYVVTSVTMETAKDGERLMNVSLRLSGGTMPAFGTVSA